MSDQPEPREERPAEDHLAEDRLADVLAACDDALHFREPSSPLPDIPEEWRKRLADDLALLHELRAWRPPPASATPRPAGTLSMGAPPPSRLGRFEIRRVLGRGGFGVVYLAYDPLLARDVALKVPRHDLRIFPEIKARFLHEARAAASLDHPNLVPLYEVGEADNVLCIASAYCPGPTLADWLAQRRQPVPAGDAAALVATLADGLQHAHSRGVLHRDLKPTNVLLQIADCKLQIDEIEQPLNDLPLYQSAICNLKSAIPKIMDFGLAKLLADVESVATPSGDIVGTPAYMSPEQAQGKTKDISTAADVYALGVILYELLTLRPPFQGETPLDILEQVRSREPTPPRRLNAAVPRDLETICLTCLRKAPQERYAGAHDLAEDLRRFLRGEAIQARPAGVLERAWKWARRRPAAAALVGVIAVAIVTLLLGGLWYNAQLREAVATAEVRRKDARAKFLKARDAVDKMLTEVANEDLAHIPHMEPVRRRLLLEAQKFYDEFLLEQSADPELRQQTGKAHDRLALIQQHLNQHEAAEKSYRRAHGLLAALVEEYPDQPEFRRDLAVSYGNLGLLLRLSQRFAEAEQLHLRALPFFEELAKNDDSPINRRHLAICHGSLGTLWELAGKTNEALEGFRRGRELLEQLVAEAPDPDQISQHRFDLAQNLINSAILLSNTKQWQPADRQFSQALALLDDLGPRFPRVAHLRDSSAVGYANLAWLCQRTGDAPRALEMERVAVVLREKLMADSPSVPVYRIKVADSQHRLGKILESLGRSGEAEAVFRKAVHYQETTARELAFHPKQQQALAHYLSSLGTLLLDIQRIAEATPILERALALRREILKKPPVVFASPKTAALPTESGPDLGLAKAGVHEAAVAASLNSLARVAMRHGDWPKVRKLLDEAVVHQRAALETDPTNTTFREDLSIQASSLGWALEMLKERAAGIKAAREAVDLGEALVAEFPEVPSHQGQLGAALNNLALLLRHEGQWLDAKRLFERAITHQRSAWKTNPKNPTYCQYLRNHWFNLADVDLHLGDHAAAARAAAEMPHVSPGRWNDELHAAKVLARCALAATKDVRLSQEQRDAQGEAYARRGIEVLNQAIRNGFTNADTLRKDAAFDSLRPRADFQAALSRLANNGTDVPRQ